MVNAERTIRHLRLRASDETQVRGVVLRLEDALRTASLPDTYGRRLVVVRKLNLGRIPAGVSPQWLAMSLERHMANQTIKIVHGILPNAGSADAVWFRDVLEVQTALALRLAKGRSAQDWYWPLAVNGWKPTWSIKESLRWLAFSVASCVEASVALPHWTLKLYHVGMIGILLESLHQGDGAKLLQLCATSSFVRSGEYEDQMIDEDDRIVWLQTMMQSVGFELGFGLSLDRASQSNPASRQLKQSTHSQASPTGNGKIVPNNLITNVQLETGKPSDDSNHDGRNTLAEHLSRTTGNRTTIESLASNELEQEGKGLVDELVIGGVETPSPGRLSTDKASRSDNFNDVQFDELALNSASVELYGEATIAGGLLFLLLALEKLGYPQWISVSKEWDSYYLIRLIFSKLLERLSVALADPVWLMVEGNQSRMIPASFVAPALWMELCEDQVSFCMAQQDSGKQLWDGAGRLLLAQWSSETPSAVSSWLEQKQLCRISHSKPNSPLPNLVAQAWLNACRRWLRRYVGLGLADLVLRPSQLSLTPTHVDFEFDLNLTDIRIRRAGLDIDPGWVSWFGRVVAFHYGRGSGA